MHLSKTRLLLIAAALVGATTLTTALLTARAIQASPQSQDEMEEMMKRYMEMATPGDEHKALMKQAGEWTFTSTFKTQQGGEASETGTATCEPLLDGRFLLMKQKSTWQGKPFNTVQILGYSKLDKRYCSVWLDSFSTGMFMSTGTANDEGVVELKGTMKDVMTPDGRQFRTRMIPKNENEFSVEVYDSMGGEEKQWGTIVYERKQP